MQYIPPEIEKIDKRIGDSSVSNPASLVWDAAFASKKPMTPDKIVDAVIKRTERKKKSAKIDALLKKAVKELHSEGFLYKFGNTYYPVINR